MNLLLWFHWIAKINSARVEMYEFIIIITSTSWSQTRRLHLQLNSLWAKLYNYIHLVQSNRITKSALFDVNNKHSSWSQTKRLGQQINLYQAKLCYNNWIKDKVIKLLNQLCSSWIVKYHEEFGGSMRKIVTELEWSIIATKILVHLGNVILDCLVRVGILRNFKIPYIKDKLSAIYNPHAAQSRTSTLKEFMD